MMHKFTIEVIFNDDSSDMDSPEYNEYYHILCNGPKPNSNEIFKELREQVEDFEKVIAIGSLFEGWISPVGYDCVPHDPDTFDDLSPKHEETE